MSDDDPTKKAKRFAEDQLGLKQREDDESGRLPFGVTEEAWEKLMDPEYDWGEEVKEREREIEEGRERDWGEEEKGDGETDEGIGQKEEEEDWGEFLGYSAYEKYPEDTERRKVVEEVIEEIGEEVFKEIRDDPSGPDPVMGSPRKVDLGDRAEEARAIDTPLGANYIQRDEGGGITVGLAGQEMSPYPENVEAEIDLDELVESQFRGMASVAGKVEDIAGD